MFTPSISIGELMLRAIVVYAFILLLLRIIGKKHIGEMAPFDLVVLLVLSESVQNALVADDKSLIGGLVVAATLFAANQLLGYATWRSKRLARLFEGTPRILVRNGRVCSDVLASEQVTAARGIAQRGLHLARQCALRRTQERREHYGRLASASAV